MTKTIAFMRIQGAMGMVRYEQQGVQGQGMLIDAGTSGIHLCGPLTLVTPQDLNAFAKAISDAYKDHMTLKEMAQPEPTPPVSGAM